ncbi:MAG: hypothetical protein IPK37_18520 [Austwickia sp.]|jgi:uncharacterized protein with PIN domain|nr:MAG: hypothetical protein IPK37_18520 [Austwickia sp.]
MTESPTVCPECGTALVRMSPDHVPSTDSARTTDGASTLYCPQCKLVRPGHHAGA